MIVFARKWILRLAFWLCYPLPLRDRVVLASSHTSELTGNLKSIYDELVARGLGHKMFVLSHPSHRGRAAKLHNLMWGIKAEYYLATSRAFIVDDYFFPLYVAHPKPSTVVIQTWHASGAFKKIGYSVLDKTFGANASLVRQVKIHSNYNYCLMGSKASVAAYSEAFNQPAEKFVTSLGIPRTDIFFNEERQAEAVKEVRDLYGLPEGKKVLLYAPTFRGTSRHAAESPTDLDIHVMQDLLREQWVILLRLHPFAAKGFQLPAESAGFIFNASDHPDINTLMIASDLLVTDYSSVIFEYSLLERPMVFFAPDAEEYEAERSFYFPYEQGVPGPVFTETAGLARYVHEKTFDLERVRSFKKHSFEVADGHATERVVERLILPPLEHRPVVGL